MGHLVNRAGRAKRTLRHGGRSLIETIVAVFIVAIMMAVSYTVFLSAFTDSRTKSCRANLQIIADEEDQYRLKSSTRSYTTVISSLSTLGSTTPICQDGGTYSVTISNGTQTAQNGQTVPSGQIIVSCSVAAHGKYAPGIDSY